MSLTINEGILFTLRAVEKRILPMNDFERKILSYTGLERYLLNCSQKIKLQKQKNFAIIIKINSQEYDNGLYRQ